MTAALLTRTLENELEALLDDEAGDCLVCGEPVEVERGRAECGGCGSVLTVGPVRAPDQLALV